MLALMETLTYLAKLGELTLKGLNRNAFERRLVENARNYLEHTGAKVRLKDSRLYIEGPETSAAAIENALTHLIGITGWARALECPKNLAAIQEEVYCQARAAKEAGAGSYKIDTRRGDKSFPLDSMAMNREAPALIAANNLLPVDVRRPDVVIHVEIRSRCFVYTNANKSCRGLPVGVSGKGLLLLSGGIDSPVAGYRMLRRGMKLDCLYFHASPYTSEEAKKKVEDIAQILARYGLNIHLNTVPFTDVQLRIRERAPAAFTTLLLRVCMVKTANLLAERIGAQCLITGESLGQVASQTIENLAVTQSVSQYPLLRPLVGLDKEEIIETAKAIGTYDISILPYEDCCVIFSPKHPVLRGSIPEVRDLYAALDMDALIQAAFENRELTHFSVRSPAVPTVPESAAAGPGETPHPPLPAAGLLPA
jgi:thiamine biosynthesis protein ThiI